MPDFPEHGGALLSFPEGMGPAVASTPPDFTTATSDLITRNFNASLQKTYEWLEDVENALPFADRQITCHSLRAVLHVLRDA